MQIKTSTRHQERLPALWHELQDRQPICECLSKWQSFSFLGSNDSQITISCQITELSNIRPCKYFSRVKKNYVRPIQRPCDSCERVAPWKTPRHQTSHWLQPRVVDVKDGQVALVNSSKSEISVRKSDHLAVRSWWMVVIWSVRKRIHFSIKISTKTQYQSFSFSGIIDGLNTSSRQITKVQQHWAMLALVREH